LEATQGNEEKFAALKIDFIFMQ